MVRFCTFNNKDNQGSVVHLGDKEVEITHGLQILSRRLGCTSQEIIVKDDVRTVQVDGRIFVVDEQRFWRGTGAPMLEVTVPYLFIPSWFKKRCPTCKRELE